MSGTRGLARRLGGLRKYDFRQEYTSIYRPVGRLNFVTRHLSHSCLRSDLGTLYNFALLTIIAEFLFIAYTAPDTISSTISRALFLSFTTAATLPIRKGRALSII